MNDNEWWGSQRITERDPLSKHLHRLSVNDRFLKHDWTSTIKKDGTIDSFHGKHEFLSNFAQCNLEYEGVTYISTEHAYQAAKTHDPNWKEAVRITETPGQSRRKGRKVPIRPDWDEVKDTIMMDILRIKFNQIRFEDELIGTHPYYLIEGVSWHDNYWGICLLSGCSRCEATKGLNRLGELLMELREEIIVRRLSEEIEAAKGM